MKGESNAIRSALSAYKSSRPINAEYLPLQDLPDGLLPGLHSKKESNPSF